MLVRWKDILRPQRYWYWTSRWDVRAARKKPFSRLSGVFDSIGDPERCLEFIEFVIFGLGVKRAPVCCRKPLHQHQHPHPMMTADVQGQPWSCWFFFFLFFESRPSASAYIIHQGNSSKDICFLNFLIKASLGREKVARSYSNKNIAISGAGSVLCQTQTEDCCNCGYWPPTSVLDQSNSQLQWLNIQWRYWSAIGSSTLSVTVGKWGRSDRDFVLLYCLSWDSWLCYTVYVTSGDHRSPTHSQNT